ncbi:hypothetical protein NSK_003925 [Nannochloropsis salina CCMP1776]|uniref:Acireductone dioxygenase n=1 Tax=Nannochloropsis salina CCMP1776 TaxID=1027361 RepID=A0A4D9D4E2_9STRA|nr:hypothetical protein NSK_003925 [Nannochloropsis salina CCMP1776]|eukprot:TFJ84893.1 hypothetical protein NSK_003925 [Nannochloropsis salina CCMP1776]
MLDAWYMDDDTTMDQREEHRLKPNKPATLEDLQTLGVLHWTFDADSYKDSPEFAAMRAERGYDYEDTCTVSRETMPNYEEKIKSFYEEHIHSDEEIRYCLDGSGYFDVRDGQDRWIRIKVEKNDLIVLPEGIYHRFTLDNKNYIKALRLFKGVPIWTPYNRPQENHPSRTKYSQSFLQQLQQMAA